MLHWHYIPFVTHTIILYFLRDHSNLLFLYAHQDPSENIQIEASAGPQEKAGTTASPKIGEGDNLILFSVRFSRSELITKTVMAGANADMLKGNHLCTKKAVSVLVPEWPCILPQRTIGANEIMYDWTMSGPSRESEEVVQPGPQIPECG